MKNFGEFSCVMCWHSTRVRIMPQNLLFQAALLRSLACKDTMCTSSVQYTRMLDH